MLTARVIMTGTITDAALVRLLTWLSPAFPTGGFAYSHGLEWAIEAGDVRNGTDLRTWVEDVLTHGAGRTDAILLQLARDGQLAIANDPEAAALTVLGMGKLGAGELNYSSDIDLILLYDRDAPALAPDVEADPIYLRIARGLVKLLQERTGDGYVFRVDLRLRPDPASRQIAAWSRLLTWPGISLFSRIGCLPIAA